MKIVFINPAWTETLGGFAKLGRERTYSPPLGLCYLAASTLKAGYDTEIIDAEAEKLTPTQIIQKVKIITPDIVGINVFSSTAHKSEEIAKELRKILPDIVIVAGAAHITIMKQKAMLDCYDYGIIDEGEITITELIKTLENNGDVSNIKGLMYRKNSEIIINPSRPRTENLDEIPFPAVQILKKDLYRLRFVTKCGEYFYASMIAMRGCPFECVFCSEPLIAGKKVRYRSTKNVVDEMERNYKEIGIGHFTFVDSNITLNRKQTFEICNEIIKRNLPITWEGWTRANLVDEELLKKMKQAGFIRMSFGIESAEPEILKIIKKEVSLEDIKTAFKLCEKIGIEALCSAMLGLPGETRKTVFNTINFIRGIREIKYSNFSIAIPYPGTEMLEMAKKGKYGLRLVEPDYTKWSRYDSSPIAVNDLSPEDLIHLQKVGILKIHLTLARMLAALKILRFSTLVITFINLLIKALRIKQIVKTRTKNAEN